MFFCFRQFDGYDRPFVFNSRTGITRFVFIQAMSRDDALVRAEALGIFNAAYGSESWEIPSERRHACYFEPRINGRTLKVWMQSYYFDRLMSPTRPEVYVHMLSGEIHGFIFGTRRNVTLERPQ